MRTFHPTQRRGFAWYVAIHDGATTYINANYIQSWVGAWSCGACAWDTPLVHGVGCHRDSEVVVVLVCVYLSLSRALFSLSLSLSLSLASSVCVLCAVCVCVCVCA